MNLSLTGENLIAILLDPEQRRLLRKALDAEQGEHLPLNNQYADLARTCAATPEQLDAVIMALLPARRARRGDERLLCWLIFHPDLSEKALATLLEKRCCLMELAHRAGPQWLLEQIAARYRTSEAITTLVLRYYSQPEYSAEAFAAFLREHAGDAMLRGNVTRLRDLSTEKQAIVQTVFGGL